MEERPATAAQRVDGNDAITTTVLAAFHDEPYLIEALRQGDETAFMMLVEHYQPTLLRLARMYVTDPAIAEEVVQETWLGVLRGLDRFEGRASLKTWIFHILMNRAKTRAIREGRSIPFSVLEDPTTDTGEPSVPTERFRPPNDPQWPRHWTSPPQAWNVTPEEILLSEETRAYIDVAIQALKPSQREVITLRDMQGLSAAEACNILGIRETNQRVLLHRARSQVRAALERYFRREPAE